MKAYIACSMFCKLLLAVIWSVGLCTGAKAHNALTDTLSTSTNVATKSYEPKGRDKKYYKSLTPEERSRTRRADELMRKVFSYGEQFSMDSLQYVSDVYLRHVMHTKRNGPIVRYIPGMLRLERGHNDYLSEAHLKLQYRAPGQIDCKVIAFHTTAKYQSEQRFHSLGRFNFQIYESKLFLDGILNPLHKRNRRFYRYTYVFISKLNDSVPPTARINITPRFSNDQLVTGFIDMDLSSGAVRNFTFQFRYQLRQITVNARMGTDGCQSILPNRLRIVSKFKLLGNKVNEVMEIHSAHNFTCPVNTQFSKQSKYDLTQLCLLRIDTTRVINNFDYFAKYRKFPLRKAEENIVQLYKQKHESQTDSIALQQADEALSNASEVDSQTSETDDFDLASDGLEDALELKDDKQDNRHPKRWFGERTQTLLLSSNHFKLSDHSRIKLPPIITPSMVGWSRTKGFSLKARARWDLFTHFSTTLPRMEFTPSIGYSFKQKQIYWEVPLLVRFSHRYDGIFSFNAGGGAHMYNSRQADELRHKLEGIEKYDSLLHIIDHYGFHDYRDAHIQTDASFSLLPGLRFTLGGCYHRRGLIEWNELAEASGMKKHFSSLGPRVQIEWTPAQYYYCEGKRRLPLYSNYPTLLFSYERGYALGRGQTHYERFEGDLRYRLSLYAMRTLFFRMGGGVYTQRGNDCFLDYDYFKFSYMPAQWNDDMTGKFQLLNSRWYNESRYYVRFTGTYESPMLLFSRLPYLSKVVQKERVYLNLLSVKALNFYSEIGYGFSTNIVDLGAFIGFAPDHSIDFGCKVVLKFFED